MPRQPEGIKLSAEVLICVEGQDEENFVAKFLEDRLTDENLYDIKCVGGSEQFHKKMPGLVKFEKFQDITTLAIIRDAETSCPNTIASLCGTLQICGLTVPPGHAQFSSGIINPQFPNLSRVGFFIMPGSQGAGMLENLCLDWFKQQYPAVWASLDQYYRDIQSHIGASTIEPIANIHKAKALMMLATSSKNSNSLGIAAKNGFFNFSSAVWQDLHVFFQAAGL